MSSISYGDVLPLKFTPALEMEIATVLEDWVIELSKKDADIDLDVEQFYAMKAVVGVITNHLVREPSND